jgi:hypothetical protein
MPPISNFMARKSRYLFFIAIFFCLNSGFISADTIGQREQFFVNDEFDSVDRTTLTATLRHIGGKAYFYVDDLYWGAIDSAKQNTLLDNIKTFAAEFDAVIYPKETQFWGSEANPGVDNDPRITILLEDLDQTNGGYFESASSYTRDRIEKSNQREMVVINAEVLAADIELEKKFLAHEFQHLISFNQKELTRNISEDTWLNEVRSEYSISLVGYNNIFKDSNLERRMSSFLETPSDSLTEWPNKNLDYGIAALFAEYLVEQFGQPILSETLKYTTSGIASLNSYFQNKGRTERFDDVFMNWMGAIYLNDNTKDTRLGYNRTELRNIRVGAQQQSFLSGSFGEKFLVQSLKDWQPAWLEFNVSLASDKSIKLILSGDTKEKFLVSYLAFFNSGRVKYGKINYSNGNGTAAIFNSAEGLNRVVVLVTKATKTSVFSDHEPSSFISVRGSIIESKEAKTEIIDGALIKRRGESEIYVIWGKYKRYLVPGVIALYGHLDPNTAIELEPEIFDTYTTSNYVKYVNDEKVYAVWPDGTKHWLNITPQQWDASYRDWNAIFTINEHEVNYYSTGANITR